MNRVSFILSMFFPTLLNFYFIISICCACSSVKLVLFSSFGLKLGSLFEFGLIKGFSASISSLLFDGCLINLFWFDFLKEMFMLLRLATSLLICCLIWGLGVCSIWPEVLLKVGLFFSENPNESDWEGDADDDMFCKDRGGGASWISCGFPNMMGCCCNLWYVPD